MNRAPRLPEIVAAYFVSELESPMYRDAPAQSVRTLVTIRVCSPSVATLPFVIVGKSDARERTRTCSDAPKSVTSSSPRVTEAARVTIADSSPCVRRIRQSSMRWSRMFLAAAAMYSLGLRIIGFGLSVSPYEQITSNVLSVEPTAAAV